MRRRLVEKHGGRTRRSWRKLHIGVDADTGRIAAAALTGHDAGDGPQTGPLLDQVAGPVASSTADGAFDRDDVYAGVAARHPDATVIVPPRSGAVPSDADDTAPTQRDEHLRCIAERGRVGRQRGSGHNRRALAESDMRDGSASPAAGGASRRTGGRGPGWRSPPRCWTECSSSGARSTSASHDPERG